MSKDDRLMNNELQGYEQTWQVYGQQIARSWARMTDWWAIKSTSFFLSLLLLVLFFLVWLQKPTNISLVLLLNTNITYHIFNDSSKKNQRTCSFFVAKQYQLFCPCFISDLCWKTVTFFAVIWYPNSLQHIHWYPNSLQYQPSLQHQLLLIYIISLHYNIRLSLLISKSGVFNGTWNSSMIKLHLLRWQNAT